MDDDERLSLSAAFRVSLETTPHLPRDQAIIELTRTYAALIDDAIDRIGEAGEEDAARDFGRSVMVVAKIGPRLEAALDRLGMSPGARPAARDGDADGAVDSSADALGRLESDAAAARQAPAPLVDPAVTEALAGE